MCNILLWDKEATLLDTEMSGFIGSLGKHEQQLSRTFTCVLFQKGLGSRTDFMVQAFQFANPGLLPLGIVIVVS